MYKVHFEDSTGHVAQELLLPRHPYVNPYELYEELAKLSHTLDYQHNLYFSTDHQTRITGGMLANKTAFGNFWLQRCLDGPHMVPFDQDMYGKEFVNPAVLCEYVFKLWHAPNIISTWEWKVNKIRINAILNRDYDWPNMFFWSLTDEALREYTPLPGERVENGLPRSTAPTYWHRDGTPVSFGTNAQGRRYVNFRKRYSANIPTYFYMVIPDSLADLMSVAKFVGENDVVHLAVVADRFRIQYDHTATLLYVKQGVDLLLPNRFSFDDPDAPQDSIPREKRPILIFDEKGLIRLKPEGDPLFLPPLNSNGRSVQVQAGCFVWDGNVGQENWKVRSLPARECILWEEDEFGQPWDPSKSWFRLLRSFNYNLKSSPQGVISKETMYDTWKLRRGETVEDYIPDLPWPKVLVHEHTADELSNGTYVLKARESLPSGEVTNFWKASLPLNRVFKKSQDEEGRDVLATYLPFVNLLNYPSFWMIIPRDLASLIDVQKWALDNRAVKHFVDHVGQPYTETYQDIRIAQVPWDVTKLVVYWVSTIPDRYFRPSFPQHRNDLPSVLQTRWRGVTRIQPRMTLPVLKTDKTIHFGLEPHNPITHVSVVDELGFPIIDHQSEFILDLKKLTSYYFQPWSQSGYLHTLVLSIPELQIKDVLLHYNSKTQQWTRGSFYQHTQGLFLPEEEPVVTYEGHDYIKLRERLDDGISTLTVILKSVDGTKSPKFYTGFNYIALHFRKTLTDLELDWE